MRKAKRKVAKKKVMKKKVAVRKVQCAAITRGGKRCKRLIVPPAKFCHLHKGWKPKGKKR